MTLKYLLDTSTLSAVIAARPSEPVIRRVSEHAARCAIASIVWNELVYGWQRLETSRRKREIDAFLHDVVLKSFPILPYDAAAARWRGIQRARQERLGRPKPYVDGQIAAIASVNGLTLVTANSKDFSGYPDLKVEDWTRPHRT